MSDEVTTPEEETPRVVVVSEPDVTLSSKFIVNGTLAACCSNPANLGEEHRSRTPNTNLPYDLVYRVCRNCGRRHFRAKAEGDTKPKAPKLAICGGCGNKVFVTPVGCPVCYNRRLVLANSIPEVG